MDILDEIKNRIEHEKRTPAELYATMRQIVMQMLFTQSMNREQVVSFCSSMIRLYESRDTDEDRHNNV